MSWSWVVVVCVLIAQVAMLAPSPAGAAGRARSGPSESALRTTLPDGGDAPDGPPADNRAAPLATTFTVNSTADTVDANPGNGVCADANGNCTLRAAIMEANALAGADIITLPAGTYTLTRSGVDNTAVNGDLDVTGPLTINGAGAANTIIQASTTGSSTAIDRIFSFNPLGTSTGFAVTLTNLTIRNGKNPNAFSTQESDGGCFDFDGGTSGLGSLTLSGVTVSNCETTDGDAGGVALFLVNGGTVSISNSTIQNNIASRNSPNWGNGGGMSVFCVNDTKTANVTLSGTTIQGNATRSVGGGRTTGRGAGCSSLARARAPPP